ncbi:hypothetical protein [Lichenibacterium minor]|nr:hypothetical protein [Lichenibacterium minor]
MDDVCGGGEAPLPDVSGEGLGLLGATETGELIEDRAKDISHLL